MSTTNELVIRPATAADLELLVAVATRTFYDAFAATNTPENMQTYMASAFNSEQLAAELADPRGSFLLAELAGLAVGYAKLYRGSVPLCVPDEQAIELSRIYIDQNTLGAGVGAALLQRCFELARGERRRTMFLGVWEHNPRAQAFYRKWGFERVGEHVFQMGDDAQTDWWMMRAL